MASPEYAQDTCSYQYVPVTGADMLADLERALALLDDDTSTYSSDISIDMEKEYVYQTYRFLRRENSPQYGVDTADAVRIRPVYFDELAYLLDAPGTHLILFGGPWDEKTQSVIDRINFLAAQYGIDTVYNFDFRADSDSPDTNIKADLTAQPGYDGPGKKPPVSAADCNYIYGELVSRFLTNAEDWADPAWGRITWLDLHQDLVTVPDLREPFLFLYNKDNTTDFSGRHAGPGRYPIISAMHLNWERGLDGTLYAGGQPVADPDGQLEAGIFRLTKQAGFSVTPWTHQDYMYEAFRQNQRGRAFKTEDCFRLDEQINICPITFAELYWLVQQKGSFLLLFCGAWCANSHAGVATINDYAVANNLRVYMIDTWADGKYPVEFWHYPRVNDLRLAMPCLQEKYFEIWETALVGAPLLLTNPGRGAAGLLQRYVDAAGEEHRLYPVNIPYLVAVNKDNTDSHGLKKPVLAACNHGGIELLQYEKSFVYSRPNYRKYSASVCAVMSAYCDSLGQPVQEKTVDRTAPVIEGSAAETPQPAADLRQHAPHDWQREMDADGIPYPWALGPDV